MPCRLRCPVFRPLFVTMMLITALVSVPAFPQSTVIKTMTLDVTNYCCWDPGYCAGWTGGTIILDQFTDPLPRASKLRSVSFLWRTGNTHTYSWQSIPHVTMNLNGTSLGEFDITNTAACVPAGAQDWTFSSQDYTNGFPGYVYGTTGQNTVSITITNTGGNVAVQWGDHRTLTLTYEAPAPIEFNVTDSAPESDRRIILTNSDPSYPYPHFQSLGGRDAEAPMYLRTKDQNGNYTTGVTVYVRVIDPADTAPYMNLPTNTLAHAVDNNGPIPIIDGTGITTVPNTIGIYQGTSGTNGELDFTLKLQQGTAGGDNYQVESSFDQTFPTGLKWHSGTLTAWKRVFVEKSKELQNGIPLSSESQIGVSTVHLADTHYRGNQGRRTVRAGDRVILVHAPAVDRQNALQGWYSEEHNVGDVTRGATDYVVTLGTRNGNTIIPEYLQHTFGRDPSQPAQPAYADRIARLAGSTLSSADYYDAPDDLVIGTGNPFTAAFVEYYILPGGPFGFVPMPDYGTDNESILQTFGEKWCLTGAGMSSAPNHQLLVIGDGDMTTPATATGVTVSQVGGQTSSWVWRGTIQEQVGSQGTNPGGDPNLWAEKTEAHELTHEFKTNAVFALADHCPSATVTYNDPTLYCLIASLDSAGGVQAQRTNGIARFHLLQLPGGAWHSEYLEIRKHADPFLP